MCMCTCCSAVLRRTQRFERLTHPELPLPRGQPKAYFLRNLYDGDVRACVTRRIECHGVHVVLGPCDGQALHRRRLRDTPTRRAHETFVMIVLGLVMVRWC